MKLPRSFDRLRPTRARLRWAFVRAIVGVLGTYVAYVVVINVLLSTSLGKKILNDLDPAHGKFDYDSAYSIWFAEVHTKGFVVRGTDSAVEWRITTDEATTTFGILDFFHRRVHMHDMTARGVSVRVRFKVDAPAPEDLAKLPPIEGLPDPPIKPPAKPELTDADYNLWTVQIDDFDVKEIHEVWVDTLRFTDSGGGHAVGAFFFEPLRVVRVEPTEFTASQGTIEIGTATIATDIHGSFGVCVAKLDPRVPKGNEALSSFDGHAVAVAKLADLSWLDPAVSPSIALTKGGGPLQISARVRQGVLEPGSHLDVRSEGWNAWSGNHWSSGSSLVHARVQSNRPVRDVVIG